MAMVPFLANQEYKMNIRSMLPSWSLYDVFTSKRSRITGYNICFFVPVTFASIFVTVANFVLIFKMPIKEVSCPDNQETFRANLERRKTGDQLNMMLNKRKTDIIGSSLESTRFAVLAITFCNSLQLVQQVVEWSSIMRFNPNERDVFEELPPPMGDYLVILPTILYFMSKAITPLIHLTSPKIRAGLKELFLG